MALTSGARLGAYEILAPLGQGRRGSALKLVGRSPAKANFYGNAPVARFPRRSARGCASLAAKRLRPARG